MGLRTMMFLPLLRFDHSRHKRKFCGVGGGQFYPKYRNYYSLFNDGGVVGDIVTAEEEMLAVLNRELRFTALKQLFVTAAVLSLENTLLALLPLGFND